MKQRLVSAKSEVVHIDDSDFDLDTEAKIDKKFNFFCKNYSYLWQNGDCLDEEVRPQKPFTKKTKEASTPNLFRSVMRKKDMIPSFQQTPYSNYTSQKSPKISEKKEKFKSMIKKISRFEKKEKKEEHFQENENEEGEKKRLEQTVKQIYEDNYQNGAVNNRIKIGEFFGNAVIAAFIEALINLSVDEVQRMKMNNEKANNLNLPPWFFLIL